VEKIAESSKSYLLKLARSAIAGEFAGRTVDFGDIPGDVSSERGVFVTLTKRGRLRGCIGNINPEDRIYESIARNAVQAAFLDPRFPKMTESELKDVSIEISILTKPEKLDFADGEDLLGKISEVKPGVVLDQGWNRATYLPQVWEEISDPRKFLSSLCVKAGLPADCWSGCDGNLSILTYSVIKFSEGDIGLDGKS